VQLLKIIGGSLISLVGLLWLIYLFYKKETTFKNKKNIFYTLVFTPGLVHIFLGTALITMDLPHLQYIYIISAAAMVLSILIGIILVNSYFIRRAITSSKKES